MFENKNNHDEKKNRSEDLPDPSVTTCRDAQFTEDLHQPVNLSLEGECNTSDQFLSFRKLSQYISLINPLNNLYKDWEKRVSNKAIGLFLTALLCIVFTGAWISDGAIKYGVRDLIWWLYNFSTSSSIYWFVPVVGFAGIGFEEAKERIDIIIEYLRVSGQEQSKKHGKERQRNDTQGEIDKIDCDETISISKNWESARTMLRENIDQIVETVRSHPDKTVGLMLEDVDRLSRAPPFEAAVFLWVLSRFDVIFYFGDMGYFDFSDPHQQLAVFFELCRSREEYNHIIERTSSGQKDVKKNNGVPGKAPFGYSKPDKDEDSDDNNNSNKLEINEQQAEVIEEGVARILSTEDPTIKVIYDDLKQKYFDGEEEEEEEEKEGSDKNDKNEENKLKEFPTYQSFRYILRNEKYTGDLKHEGEVVGHIPTIVSVDEYDQVIEKIGKSDNEQNDDLDHELQSIIERFGIDGSIQLFDIIKGKCPECGGDVTTDGSAKRWGHRVLNYNCTGKCSDSQEATEDEYKNDEESNNDESEECDFNGPLLNELFLQKWEHGLPIVCPRCHTPADEDDWEKSDTRIDVFEQTCSECGLWYSADVNIDYDSPINRGMDYPEHAIRWFDDDNTESDDESSDHQSTDSKDTGSKDTDSGSDQEKLDNFD